MGSGNLKRNFKGRKLLGESRITGKGLRCKGVRSIPLIFTFKYSFKRLSNKLKIMLIRSFCAVVITSLFAPFLPRNKKTS